MEDLTVEQQLEQRSKECIAKALKFTDNDLLKIIDDWDLKWCAEEQFDKINDIVNDLDHNLKDNNIYYNIIRDMFNIDLINEYLHNFASCCDEYENNKKLLDSFSLSRPEVINIKPINKNDTIPLTQLWNYVQNKTEQIKLKCFNDIKEFSDNNTKKTNEYYSRIKEIILSGYSKLYSFLTIAGSDIEEYIDKNPNN